MIVKVDRDFFLLNFFHHVWWSLNTKNLENSFKNDLTEEKRLLCSAPGRKIRGTAWSYDKVYRFGEASIMLTTYLGVTVCQTRLILAGQDSKQLKTSNMVRNKFLALISISWLPIASTPHWEKVSFIICLLSPSIEELASKEFYQSSSYKIQPSHTN